MRTYGFYKLFEYLNRSYFYAKCIASYIACNVYEMKIDLKNVSSFLENKKTCNVDKPTTIPTLKFCIICKIAVSCRAICKIATSYLAICKITNSYRTICKKVLIYRAIYKIAVLYLAICKIAIFYRANCFGSASMEAPWPSVSCSSYKDTEPPSSSEATHTLNSPLPESYPPTDFRTAISKNYHQTTFLPTKTPP